MTYSDEFLKAKAEAIANSRYSKPRPAKRLLTGELLKDAIMRMRAEGATFIVIKAELGCSFCTIHYHLDAGGKEKADMRKKKFVAKQAETVKPEKEKKQDGRKKNGRVAKLPVDGKPKEERRFKTKSVLPGQKVRIQINHKTWIEVDPAKNVAAIKAKYEKALDYDRAFKHGRF